MEKLEFPDVGYTPNNLRRLLEAANITQQECADLLKISLRTVNAWCAPLGVLTHSDMPIRKWEELKKLLLTS